MFYVIVVYHFGTLFCPVSQRAGSFDDTAFRVSGYLFCWQSLEGSVPAVLLDLQEELTPSGQVHSPPPFSTHRASYSEIESILYRSSTGCS